MNECLVVDSLSARLTKKGWKVFLNGNITDVETLEEAKGALLQKLDRDVWILYEIAVYKSHNNDWIVSAVILLPSAKSLGSAVRTVARHVNGV